MNLKKVRIGVAFPVFCLFVLSFLGDEHISSFFSDTLLAFQLFPALVRLLLAPVTLLSACFFVLVLISLLFGRIYCSFLCPLGMLQDGISFLSRKIGLRKKHFFMNPQSLIRYSILLLVSISIGIGSLTPLRFLDPYSIFGRFIANLVKTLFIYANNLLVDIFKSFDWYILSVKRPHFISLSLLSITVVSILIVVAFSLLRGRMFCNTICPAGTLLGLISRFSLFRFVIDGEKCRSCSLCETVCKAGCIDTKKAIIDQSRCVACFNCINTCRKSACSYRIFPRLDVSNEPVPTKRKLLLTSAALGGSVIGLFPPVQWSFNVAWAKTDIPITPPGSLSISRFTDTCSACHLCVSVCMTNVLTPTFLKYGVSGMLQPVLDFSVGHCDYYCNACGQVCPTGAIDPLLPEEKKTVQIGTVSLNKEICVVYDKKNHCGACGEACPTFAVSATGPELHFAPLINTDYCIGCGACEIACPTSPKAIFVTANIVHAKAKKYVSVESPVENSDSQNSDFPF